MLDKLYSLQYLRGIASWIVVFFHAYDVFGRFQFEGMGEYMFSSGNVGVDIFFILSGFVMSASIKRNQLSSLRSLFQFLKRRWLRVFPPYFFWTFFFIVFYLKDSGFLSDKLHVLVYSMLFIPGSWEFPPLSVGWTLNYEMYFYLVIALFSVFKQERLLILFFIICPIAGMFYTTTYPYLDKIVFSVFLWEFLFGILMYKYSNVFKFTKTTTLYLFISVSICFLVFYLFSFANVFYLKMFLSVLLVFSFIKMEQYYSFENRFLKFVGDSSYSVYLCHLPVLAYIPNLLGGKFHFTSGFLNSIYGDFFMVIIIFVVSVVSYYFIEKPLMLIAKHGVLSFISRTSIKSNF